MLTPKQIYESLLTERQSLVSYVIKPNENIIVQENIIERIGEIDRILSNKLNFTFYAYTEQLMEKRKEKWQSPTIKK